MSCAGALPDSIIMQRSLKHWQLASSQGRFKCPNRATSEKEGRSKKRTLPAISMAPRLKEAVQWINQAADEHARKVRAEFFEAVDEVIEFLDERRDADSEGCNTEMRLHGVLSDAFACYKRTLAHNDIEILPT